MMRCGIDLGMARGTLVLIHTVGRGCSAVLYTGGKAI